MSFLDTVHMISYHLQIYSKGIWWLIYKNKGKMFPLTNDQATDEYFFLVLFFLFGQ